MWYLASPLLTPPRPTLSWAMLSHIVHKRGLDALLCISLCYWPLAIRARGKRSLLSETWRGMSPAVSCTGATRTSSTALLRQADGVNFPACQRLEGASGGGSLCVCVCVGGHLSMSMTLYTAQPKKRRNRSSALLPYEPPFPQCPGKGEEHFPKHYS